MIFLSRLMTIKRHFFILCSSFKHRFYCGLSTLRARSKCRFLLDLIESFSDSWWRTECTLTRTPTAPAPSEENRQRDWWWFRIDWQLSDFLYAENHNHFYNQVVFLRNVFWKIITIWWPPTASFSGEPASATSQERDSKRRRFWVDWRLSKNVAPDFTIKI